MWKTAGNKCGIAIAQFILPALDQANSRTFDNGDGLIEIVDVTRQGCAWKKASVSTAYALGAITTGE